MNVLLPDERVIPEKRVVRTKFDIYVYTTIILNYPCNSTSRPNIVETKYIYTISEMFKHDTF